MWMIVEASSFGWLVAITLMTAVPVGLCVAMVGLAGFGWVEGAQGRHLGHEATSPRPSPAARPGADSSGGSPGVSPTA